jgi:radical SAM/Cys-rich protein
VEVIDRCNLTILQEEGQEGLAAFLAEQGVHVVASLPCYQADNVDRQRGAGVFARSIAGLQELNRHGFGQPGSGLELDLVFNPQGAVLPPPQRQLEEDYRQVLAQDHGVVFSRLLALTNMPIQRFAQALGPEGLERYDRLLRLHHRQENLAGVMCRSLLSVDWQGRLHDCDFNQQLELGLPAPRHLRDLLDWDPCGGPIGVGGHCFGCTAGAGSSCSGSLA